MNKKKKINKIEASKNFMSERRLEVDITRHRNTY